MSNSFVDKYAHHHNALDRLPTTDKQVILDIIELLSKDTDINHENLIFSLIDKVLGEMGEQGMDLELGMMHTSERLVVENEIKALVNDMKKSGKNVNAQDVIKLILGTIHRRFHELYSSKINDKFSNTEKTKKAEKDYRKQISQMIAYEFYKFIYPPRPFREADIDNFINRVLIGTLKFGLTNSTLSLNKEESLKRDTLQLQRDTQSSSLNLNR